MRPMPLFCLIALLVFSTASQAQISDNVVKIGVLTDLSGPAVLITDVNALGLKAAQGLVLTTSFYWDMDEKTREWSKRFFAKIQRMPTMWQAGVYSSIMHYLKAVQAAGTDEPLRLAAKMRETPVEDFFRGTPPSAKRA